MNQNTFVSTQQSHRNIYTGTSVFKHISQGKGIFVHLSVTKQDVFKQKQAFINETHSLMLYSSHAVCSCESYTSVMGGTLSIPLFFSK